jgi:hypothetical protein
MTYLHCSVYCRTGVNTDFSVEVIACVKAMTAARTYTHLVISAVDTGCIAVTST